MRRSLEKMQKNRQAGLLFNPHERKCGCKEGLERGRCIFSIMFQLCNIKPNNLVCQSR
jgi:hypothetical protein